MTEIKKLYKDGCIIYNFSGSLDKNDTKYIENMFKEDMDKTYAFIFSLNNINSINADGVRILQNLYLKGIYNSCEIVISSPNAQTVMMLEILQANKLYMIKSSLNEALEIFQGTSNAFYHY